MLERLHKAELEIMCEFDRICRKHHIPYFLDSGTALGAVRHRGFIPWDDDVDIGMLRSDYERFLLVAKEELSPRFFLQNKESEPAYYKYNAKLRMENTYFPEGSLTDKLQHRGIFIDIYPFDYAGHDEKEAQRRIVRSRRMLRLLRFRQTGSERSGWKKRIAYALCSVIPERYFEKKYCAFCSNPAYDGAAFITCFSYRMLQSKMLCFPTEKMLPVRDTAFEDQLFCLMHDPDDYLTRMYGDYMQLPAEEDRVCHLAGEVRFSDR